MSTTYIDLDRVHRSNILQMFAVTEFASPYMDKDASIINPTSVTTCKGNPAMVDPRAPSSASRDSWQRTVSREQRVNAVAPGPVHTPLQPASRPAEQIEGRGEQPQLGRPGQPSKIAPTYVFLASVDAELYYGQVMQPYPLGD